MQAKLFKVKIILKYMNNPKIKKDLKGPIYEKGYQVLKNKHMAIVWMSVGNSYFKPKRIEGLLNFIYDKFSKIVILAPFEPAEYTYRAIGYPENIARKKAKLNSNRLKNHTQRILKKHKKKFTKCDIRIIDWDIDILPNKFFKESYKSVKKLYHSNKKFKEDVRETTERVLDDKIKEGINLKKAVDIGVYYLLEEISFIISSPKIFSVKKSAYVYHHKWPIFEELVDGKYDKKIRDDVGFLLIRL